MKDANGTEIKVGSIVRALHKPEGTPTEWGGADTNHDFFGTAKVTHVLTSTVLVEKTCPKHNPVHCPALLVVVP